MARKNSEVNPFVKQLIEQNKIKSADDTQDFMKNIFENMSNTLMQAEFEEDIGYDKYDRELRLIVVPKCSRDISDINAHIDEIYGLIFLASQISRITDRVFEEIDLEEKDILSSVTGENESSKFWLKVVNELRYMNYRIFLIFLWKLER